MNLIIDHRRDADDVRVGDRVGVIEIQPVEIKRLKEPLVTMDFHDFDKIHRCRWPSDSLGRCRLTVIFKAQACCASTAKPRRPCPLITAMER